MQAEIIVLNQGRVEIVAAEFRGLNTFEHHQGPLAGGLVVSAIGIEEQHAVVSLLLEAQDTIREQRITLETNPMADQDVVDVEAVSTCSGGEVLEFQGVAVGTEARLGVLEAQLFRNRRFAVEPVASGCLGFHQAGEVVPGQLKLIGSST